jgi:hypothetical protein
MTPPSLVMLPPSNQPSITRRPKRPNSIDSAFGVAVQFGIGSPQLKLASDTNDNGLGDEAADIVLPTAVKYAG